MAARRTHKANGRTDSGDALRRELGRYMDALAESGPRAEPREIVAAVESVMATVEGDLSAVNLKLYAEIEALSRYIESAKAEIAEVRPDEIRDRHLPTATDELEAIVGSTEQATNSILEAVETIEEVAAEVDEATAEKITGAVTTVYEACNFQDITGQRITKVVKALQQIERKVDALLLAFGEDAERERARSERQARPVDGSDEGLLNGPSMPNEGISQEDIDALLASFD